MKQTLFLSLVFSAALSAGIVPFGTGLPGAGNTGNDYWFIFNVSGQVTSADFIVGTNDLASVFINTHELAVLQPGTLELMSGLQFVTDSYNRLDVHMYPGDSPEVYVLGAVRDDSPVSTPEPGTADLFLFVGILSVAIAMSPWKVRGTGR